jgi:hypothetical protein
MAIILKTISIIAIVFLVLFFLSLIIYFFNLDMKTSSKIQPFINKWYDRHKRRPLP